ncbi:DUF1801 domain-containing protein [Ruegeria arenilitoris]|uniref:DUF1801 domain-containing protein n=1 Tax=Ruegeria arenilitoris TaxID=1173585 RepID=UPI00148134D2|nr:DUF1801 domain-containing protein [Ruegeria arenilitoris]
MKPFDDPSVAAAFDAFPVSTRTGALSLRELILDTAQSIPSALPLQEALRWGQPAYLAPKGSTIRLGKHRWAPFALFVHCQSRLMPEFTAAFPGEDRIDGNRAILFDDPQQIDETRHGWLIARALIYHL